MCDKMEPSLLQFYFFIYSLASISRENEMKATSATVTGSLYGLKTSVLVG